MKKPTNWKYENLASLLSRKATYGIVQPGAHVPNGMPLIRSQDYSTSWCPASEIMRVAPEIEKPYARSRVSKGDLLITVVGANIGRIATVPDWLDGANISRSVARISVNGAIANPNYIRSFLQGGIRRLLHINSNGGAQPVLNLDDLREFEVPLPPLPEQQKIADVLGTWDAALEKLDALITANERLKKSLVQQLLSGQRRNPRFRAKWAHFHLKDVAAESNQRNGTQLNRARLYAVTKAEGMVPMREQVQGATIDRCKIVECGWFAYNPMRINIGSIARWENASPVMVSPDYVVFRTDESRLLSDYLNHLRRSAHWSSFVGGAGNGSVRVRIWFDDLGHLKLHLPPVAEQRAIADVLDTADTELRLLRSKRESVDEQKRGLMQKLLTGKVRVST